MSEIKDLKIVPSRDIYYAKWLRYRAYDRKLEEYIVLGTVHGEFVIPKRQISQLFRYLDATVTQIRGKKPWTERNTKLWEVLTNCDKELIFSILINTVVRITSTDFTSIPHGKLLQIFERVLKLDYESRDIKFNSGMFAKWTLKSLPKECANLGDIVSWQIWTYNYNVGNKSLKIGGGFTVLKCQNGAIGWKTASKVRIIHRGEYEDLLSKIHETVDSIVNNELPLIALQIQEAQKVKAAKEAIYRLIRLYPQWIQDKLREQLRKAHTLWDVSNAFSWVATHEPVTFNQQIQLSNHAVEVLNLVERR